MPANWPPKQHNFKLPFNLSSSLIAGKRVMSARKKLSVRLSILRLIYDLLSCHLCCMNHYAFSYFELKEKLRRELHLTFVKRRRDDAEVRRAEIGAGISEVGSVR